MGLSPTHIIILAIVAVLLFGGGRFSNIMTDVAKGVRGFKKSMAEEEEEVAQATPRLEATPNPTLPAERALQPLVAEHPVV